MSQTILHVAYAEVRVISAEKLWKSFPSCGRIGRYSPAVVVGEVNSMKFLHSSRVLPVLVQDCRQDFFDCSGKSGKGFGAGSMC